MTMVAVCLVIKAEQVIHKYRGARQFCGMLADLQHSLLRLTPGQHHQFGS